MRWTQAIRRLRQVGRVFLQRLLIPSSRSISPHMLVRVCERIERSQCSYPGSRRYNRMTACVLSSDKESAPHGTDVPEHYVANYTCARQVLRESPPGVVLSDRVCSVVASQMRWYRAFSTNPSCWRFWRPTAKSGVTHTLRRCLRPSTRVIPGWSQSGVLAYPHATYAEPAVLAEPALGGLPHDGARPRRTMRLRRGWAHGARPGR